MTSSLILWKPLTYFCDKYKALQSLMGVKLNLFILNWSMFMSWTGSCDQSSEFCPCPHRSTKTHPGPVVHLSDSPKDEGKVGKPGEEPLVLPVSDFSINRFCFRHLSASSAVLRLLTRIQRRKRIWKDGGFVLWERRSLSGSCCSQTARKVADKSRHIDFPSGLLQRRKNGLDRL